MKTTLCMVLCGVVFGTHSICCGSEDDVVIKISRADLEKSLGFSARRARSEEEDGLLFFSEQTSGPRISSVHLVVLPTVALAKQQFKYACLRMSSMPLSLNVDAGNDFCAWNGTLFMRRDNVYVSIGWIGDMQPQALELARKLDNMVQKENDVTKRGVLKSAPQIANVPETIVVREGEFVDIQPQAIGMENASPVRVTTSEGTVLTKALDNGKIRLFVHSIASKARELHIDLSTTSEGGMVVCKRILLKIENGPNPSAQKNEKDLK
jgi:hypothetical protein